MINQIRRRRRRRRRSRRSRWLPSDVHASGSYECRCPLQGRQVTVELLLQGGLSRLAMVCASEHPGVGSAGADVLSSAREDVCFGPNGRREVSR